MRQHHDKYARSCYRDQVSSISSYRCKRPNSVKTLQRDTKNESEENVWKNIIKSKEKDLEREIHQRIIESKQSLLECNERLLLKNQELPVLLKAAKIIADYYVLVTLRLTWKRYNTYNTRTEARRNEAAAIVVRLYVARCQRQRRTRKEKRMSMVRERAIRQYVTHHKRRKVIELEHKAATTCQAVIRSFFARRYTDSIVNR